MGNPDEWCTQDCPPQNCPQAILMWAILRVIGHKPLEWEGSVSSLISHNAIDFGFFLALFRFIPFLLYFLRRLSTSPAVWVFRILGVLSEERAWIHLFLPQLNYVNALCGQRGSRMLWIPQREDSWAGGWLFLGPGKAANREEVFSNSRREDRRPGFLFATSHRRDLLTILFGKYQQRLKTWNPRAGKLPPNKTLRDGILFSFLKLDFVGRCGI